MRETLTNWPSGFERWPRRPGVRGGLQRRRRYGGVGIWMLLALLLSGALLVCLDDATWGAPLLIALLVAAFGVLLLGWRSEPDNAARVTLLLGLGTTLGAGLGLMLADDPGIMLKLATGTGICALVVSIVALNQYRFGADPLPHPLREAYDDDQIYECDGIQLALGLTSDSAARGEVVWLTIDVLSCIDHTREIAVHLKSEQHVFGGNQLQLPEIPSLQLPAGSEGRFAVPLGFLPESRTGKWVFVVKPSVLGPQGARIRRWRARPLPAELPAWFRALGALVGGLGMRHSGLWFSIQVSKNPGALAPAAESAWSEVTASLASDQIDAARRAVSG